MKKLPRSKTVLFLSLFTVVAAILTIIPINFGAEARTVVALDKNSFEDYFNVEISYTTLNNILQVNYNVSPKSKSIVKSEQSTNKIVLTVTVSFYKDYNASGFSIDSKDIQIVLLKSKDYSARGVESISVPIKAQSYKLYISRAIGKICE